MFVFLLNSKPSCSVAMCGAPLSDYMWSYSSNAAFVLSNRTFLHATTYSENEYTHSVTLSFAYLTIAKHLEDLSEAAATNPFEDLVRRFLTFAWPRTCRHYSSRVCSAGIERPLYHRHSGGVEIEAEGYPQKRLNPNETA